ncbi:bifunctional diguanylate cyclase/phosphodiesterase [Oceanimonas sp. MB9]|uniref:putative bifunctional diguanylate cyclase/phosphodiesterase n=1 Tax=Oceanimonas sp. MB9 TaxID=2588453 RepID=UPI0013F5D052|nr:bifunctional diguanylate cyclase/phosphodiesterase [Oceanimonas sp. MB9]NHH99124.1 putative signaling protein [Oceanimonas sp. MB9]
MENGVLSWFNLWCLSQLVEQRLADGAMLCRRRGTRWQPLLAAGMPVPDSPLSGLDSRPQRRLTRRQCAALGMASGQLLSLADLYPGHALLLFRRQRRVRLSRSALLGFFATVFTHHDRAQQAISRLALFERLPLPLVRLTLDGVVEWSNAAVRRIAGLDGQMAGRSLREFSLGGDWPETLRLYRRLADEPALGMAVVEKHYRHPDGRLLLGEVQLTLVRNQRGEPMCLMAALASLRPRAPFREGLNVRFIPAPEQPEGVMICDGNSRILDVSPAFERVTGFREEEVRGSYPSLLRSGLHSREFYRRMNQALNDRGFWRGEVWNRRKSGQVYPERLRIGSLRGPGGALRYVAVFSDMGQPDATEQGAPPEVKDSLTGLANRASFQQRLARHCRLSESFALLILDINNFRLFNNAMNHKVGDQVLQEVASRLRGRLRSGDFLARIGSDEFALLVPGIVHHRQARIFGRHLLSALARPLPLAEQQLYVDATLGGALWPGVGEEDAESLLQHAEQALFGAKQKKEALALYDDQLNRAQSRRMRLQHDLMDAIHQGGLRLHYQPIVDTQSGRVTKLEALVRWQHEELGAISPVEFVPVAEESGLVQALGDWVLNRACTDLRRLHQAGYPLQMAINRSSLEFQSLGLAGEEWLAIIERHQLSPRHLIFEITESLFMQGNEHHLERISALRRAGCRIAIDDFGTGFSALNYLRAFPIDLVKIDKSFIDHLPGNQKDGLLLEGILRIIGDLGMKVVIEGMETPAQATYLSTQPCHFLQGYLIAKPMPLRELLVFLESYAGHTVSTAD